MRHVSINTSYYSCQFALLLNMRATPTYKLDYASSCVVLFLVAKHADLGLFHSLCINIEVMCVSSHSIELVIPLVACIYV